MGRLEDCQGQACQGGRLLWAQGEDSRWHDEEQPHEELERQDCLEGEVGPCQEELRQGLGLVDRCGESGPQGTERHWLRGSQRQEHPGKGYLRKGQGALQVVVRLGGLSQDAERRRKGCPRKGQGARHDIVRLGGCLTMRSDGFCATCCGCCILITLSTPKKEEEKSKELLYLKKK